MPPHDDIVPFEQLLAHQGFLSALAQRLVGNEPDAEDLVQDAWLATLQTPATRAKNLKAWLSAVARNRWRNRRRDDDARARRERQAARSEHVDGEAAEHGLELRRRVLEAVAALPESYRTAIYLRYFEERPIAEVAARTGVPAETARSRIQRGVELLRAKLDREFGSRASWMAAVGAWCETPAQRGRAAPPLAPAAGSPLVWIGVAGLSSCALVLCWMALRSSTETSAPELTASADTGEPEREIASAEATRRIGSSAASQEPDPLAARASTPLDAAGASEPTSAAAPMERTGHEHRDHRIRGRVLGPSGLPIAGARILYLGEEWSRTDRDGRFEMDVEMSIYRKADRVMRPSLPLIASHEGYEPCVIRDLAARIPEDPDAILELEMVLGSAPRALAGRIERHDGSPAAGWQVALRDPSYAYAVGIRDLQTLEGLASGRASIQSADADGRFRLEGLLARAYDVIAWDPENLHHALAVAVPESASQVVLTAPDPAVARRVAGRVLSRAGEPLAGVRVRASKIVIEPRDFPGPATRMRGRAVATDALGRFEFPAEFLEPLQLVVEADALLVYDVLLDPLPASENWESLELCAPLRCEVVLDARSPEPPADLLAFLDDAGAKLFVLLPAQEHEAMGGLPLWQGIPLAAGPSRRIVHVSEEAATLLFYDRDGTEVERRPVRLSSASPTTIAW